MLHQGSACRIRLAASIPSIPGISISRMAIWTFSLAYTSRASLPFSA